MRAVAERLGVSAMTLYTYVPGKAELLDLMLDALWLAMPRETGPTVRSVADANRALYAAHPWAARVTTARPPLGPGLLAKYEHELGALDGLGLSDVDMDAALTLVLGFVQGIAAQEPATTPDAEWWETAGPLLAEVVDPERYPLASRVGTAAGEAQGGAYDAERAYRSVRSLLEGLDHREGWNPDQVPLVQDLGDLDRVGRGALEQVVRDDPQAQPALVRGVAPQAADEDVVAAGRAERGRVGLDHRQAGHARRAARAPPRPRAARASAGSPTPNGSCGRARART